MKRVANFALAAILFAGLFSCAKELDNGTDGAQNGTSGFQISLQASKGTLTYAGIASDPEWDFGAVNVFLFDKTTGDILGTNADFDITTATGSATLTAKAAWLTTNKGKFVNVYFVGNNAAANLFGASAQATGLATEAAFIEQVTSAQSLITTGPETGKANLLTTPLLFSASAKNIQVPAVGLVNTNVTLKRREARFDIVNPDKANFTVTKVLVSNANIQGFVFANATTTPTMAAASLAEIDATDAAKPYDTTDPTLKPSVFYLYPTQLGTGNTEITIFGILDSEEKIFEVKSAAKIEANKRYKLVFDPAAMVFNMIAVDYDEGWEFPTELIAEAMSRGAITSSRGLYLDNTYYFDDNALLGTLSHEINSANGTTVEVFYHTGLQGDLISDIVVPAPTSVATYAYGVTETYEIIPPRAPANDDNFRIQVVFTSKTDLNRRLDINFIRYKAAPATENILAVDGSGELNLDGNGTPLYFRWGSLIGIGQGSGNLDVFGSEDVLWAPTGFNLAGLKTTIDGASGNGKWNAVPFISGSSAMPATNDLIAGRGDPCKLASKGGVVGGYRMPTGDPYETFVDGVWDDSNPGLHSLGDGQFYPAAGGRAATGGSTVRMGCITDYWSSTNVGNQGYILYSAFGNNMIIGRPMSKQGGYVIRCVPN